MEIRFNCFDVIIIMVLVTLVELLFCLLWRVLDSEKVKILRTSHNLFKMHPELKEIASRIFTDLGIKSPKYLRVTDKPMGSQDGSTLSGYFLPKGKFLILLANRDPFSENYFTTLELVATLAHEARHMYQFIQEGCISNALGMNSLTDKNEIDADGYAIYFLQKEYPELSRRDINNVVFPQRNLDKLSYLSALNTRVLRSRQIANNSSSR